MLTRICFFLVLATVLWLTLSDGGQTPVINDKIAHFLAFLVLGILGLAAWPERPGIITASLLAFAAAIELLQGTFFIRRDAELLDWIADGGGVAASLVIRQVARSRARL